MFYPMTATDAPAPSYPQDFARRLAAILFLLLPRVAAAGKRVRAQLITAVWAMLSRTRQRVDRLSTRLAAGTYKRRVRIQAPRPARQRRAPNPLYRAPLPRESGWLLRHVGDSPLYREMLATLLAEPEARALLEATPALARTLRPLCRMLHLADPLTGAQPRPMPRPRGAKAPPVPPKRHHFIPPDSGWPQPRNAPPLSLDERNWRFYRVRTKNGVKL